MAGSIEDRGGNTWRLVVSAGFDASGKRRKVTKTIHGTRREAEKALARLTTEVADGKVALSAGMPLADWAREWQKQTERRCAPKTVFTYGRFLALRILPALGKVPIGQLGEKHLKAWVNALDAVGARKDGRGERIGAATQGKAWRVLSACLQEAVYAGLIPLNPCATVKGPRAAPRAPLQVADEDTVRAILDALQKEPARLRAIVLLALEGGLRRGEIAGLRWHDVDIARNLLHVRQAAYYVPGKGQDVKAPKTAGSIRSIPLPLSPLTEALADWRAVQVSEREICGSLWQDQDGYAFTEPDGSPLRVDHVDRTWRRFLLKHNESVEAKGYGYRLPLLRFHDLRHACASHLLALGVPVGAVAAILGHSKTSTTLDVYGHAMLSTMVEGAATMAAFLRTTADEKETVPKTVPKRLVLASKRA